MKNQTTETHNTSTINGSVKDYMGYCLAKPGDKVRITKTHRAGIHQYLACEGDTFIITKVVDNQIPYGPPARLLGVRQWHAGYMGEKSWPFYQLCTNHL